jgi:Domain of unknown function (DUF4383)
MTTVQRVAQIFGIIFILVAIVGFLASGMSMEADPVRAPHVLGLFPVNALHNVVHLLLGVWALVAARTFAGARSYARIAGVLYLVLAVVGFIAPNGFGLVPLGGNAIWLHAVLGLVLAAVGFTAKELRPPVSSAAA